ncbi:MAG TPA: ATPase, T2SS/T4P/T4SS family [Bdellovibrionota bacterium]|nr:ATPase, T2SS/T4P/T4SS family [Bdellovibrionota bacterium]
MKNIGQILLEKGLITSDQLQRALEFQKSRYGLMGEILVELGFVSEETVLTGLCEQLSPEHQQLVYFQSGKEVVTTDIEIPPNVIAMVPSNMLVKCRAVPIRFDQQKNDLTIAFVDISDLRAVDEIRFYTNKKINAVQASRADIQYLWKKFYNVEERVAVRSPLDLSNEIKLGPAASFTETSITKLFDNIITKAIALGTSDIHFDIYGSDAIVRFRIDGVLYNVLTIPLELYAKIISRAKILSNMDVSERKISQDGRITVKTPKGQAVELRLAIIPVYNGERLAIRLLDKSGFDYDLEGLGIHKLIFDRFKSELEKPAGMVLVTGPTGSGKTTTIYSMVNFLNDSSRSVVSIEDPVEYEFRGVGQVQVDEKKGFTFGNALRGVLRQDPNVIMVGEIRDEDTADISTRAALTGHLVLATMHTNDAPTAIARLSNMGVKPFVIASCLNMAVAQRLVRRLCLACKVDDKPNPRLLLRLGLKPAQLEKLRFSKGKGCPTCSFTGYKGRLAILEVMFVTSRMRDLIAKEGTVEDLRRMAKREKMIALNMDGLYKAKEGLTTIEEVVRTTFF